MNLLIQWRTWTSFAVVVRKLGSRRAKNYEFSGKAVDCLQNLGVIMSIKVHFYIS